MIAFAIVLVIIGAVLLAIASPRKGGNLEIGTSDIRTNLPEITGLAKIPAFILGLVLIGVGLWMGILLFTKSFEEGDKKVAENPQVTSTPKAELELSPKAPIANVPTSTDTPELPTWTPTFTPEPPPTYVPPPTFTQIPTITPVPPSQPQVECDQGGSLSSSSIPAPPPQGCVLIIEWWYPPNPTPCGIWITIQSVQFNNGVEGHWWYIYPDRVPSHIKEYKDKQTSAPCDVKDFRQ